MKKSNNKILSKMNKNENQFLQRTKIDENFDKEK